MTNSCFVKNRAFGSKGILRAHRVRPGRQSRSLFIRTMTVGPGIAPGLLTLSSGGGRSGKRSRARHLARHYRRWGLSPALRTLRPPRWPCGVTTVAPLVHRPPRRRAASSGVPRMGPRGDQPVVAHRADVVDPQLRRIGHPRQRQSSKGRALEPRNFGATNSRYSSTSPSRAKAPARRGRPPPALRWRPRASSTSSLCGRHAPRRRAAPAVRDRRPGSVRAPRRRRRSPPVPDRPGRTPIPAAPAGAVDQHPQRLASRGERGKLGVQAQLVGAYVEPRIVRQQRIGAGQHHAGASAQALHRRTRGGAGDPLAFPAGHGGAPVQAHRQLDPDERQAMFHALDETDVEFPRLGLEDPLCTAIPACIRRSRPRPATSGLGSCIAATTRATPAPTSASAHGGCGRSGCRARGSRRRWRRVHSRRPGAGHGPRRAARRRGRASPRRPPGRPDQHAADARIRMGGVQPLARQFQGAGHVQRVGGVHSLAGSRARRSISSRNSLRSWKRR